MHIWSEIWWSSKSGRKILGDMTKFRMYDMMWYRSPKLIVIEYEDIETQENRKQQVVTSE